MKLANLRHRAPEVKRHRAFEDANHAGTRRFAVFAAILAVRINFCRRVPMAHAGLIRRDFKSADDAGTPSLFLLLHPADVLHQAGVFQQRLFGRVMFGQLFFGEEIVDAGVTEPTDLDAARPHLQFGVSLLIATPPVNRLGDQMMKSERFVASAQFAQR